MDTVSVAILGATGYAGIELVRLVTEHPSLRLTYASSEQYVGRTLAQVYPFLGRRGGLALGPLDVDAAAAEAEIVFASLPHGTAASTVAALLERGRTVIDLSADFRLRDPATFERTYGTPHPAPELLSRAVFGLTELHRDELRGARLVANPGCYPTGALLGVAPLVRSGARIDSIIVDAKSGASGAGRGAKTELLFCEVNENLRAYQVGVHRHAPEIEQGVARSAPGAPPPVFFVPHFMPITRGILSTIYLACRELDAETVGRLFAEAYGDAPFVELRGEGTYPEVREVRGTNRCAIGWQVDRKSGLIVVVTVIDNLLKGAAGQAVQNLNVVSGWEEERGLEALAVVP
jgi:N-acetyl-gamma-glutamyl-phosphate reductase